MHDNYQKQQMESTMQKVFGATASVPTNPYLSAASLIVTDDSELRPPPPKRASRMANDSEFKHVEFPSTSFADFFNLNGAPTAPRLNFPSAAFVHPQPSSAPTTNSETWARLLAAGTNSLSPLSSMDEAFVEIFAEKVAAKVINALSPQIQQIRTAIIGLARLVEMNQTAMAMAERRVQSPPTPPQQQHHEQVQAQSLINTTTTASATTTSNKKRNPSPSKVEIPTTSTGLTINANENDSALNVLAKSVAKSGGSAGGAGVKSERKGGDAKSIPKRSVKEVPDVYRIIKLDDLGVHFNMTEKLCLICRETFTESHLHSVKRHMYRKHRGELDTVLQRKTNDPLVATLSNDNSKMTTVTTTTTPPTAMLVQQDLISIAKGGSYDMKDDPDQNELIDVVDVGSVSDQLPSSNKFQSGITL